VTEEDKQLEEDVEEITERLNAVLGEVSDKASPETERNLQSPVLTGAEVPVLDDEHQTRTQALEDPVRQDEAGKYKETKEKL